MWLQRVNAIATFSLSMNTNYLDLVALISLIQESIHIYFKAKLKSKFWAYALSKGNKT